MREKLFFENWQRLAYNPETWTMEYYNDYVGNIKIFQLDEQDIRRYGVNLVECFPKTIAAQPIAYGSVNQVQTVQKNKLRTILVFVGFCCLSGRQSGPCGDANVPQLLHIPIYSYIYIYILIYSYIYIYIYMSDHVYSYIFLHIPMYSYSFC